MLLDEERWAGSGKAGPPAGTRRLRRLSAGIAAPGAGLWALVAILAGLDAVWLAAAGIALAWPGLLVVVGVITVLLALSLLFSAVRPEPKLRAMALSSAYLAAFTTAAAVLHYLAATLALPLADPILARFEATLGFDWPAWVGRLAAHPELSWWLALAYHSSGPQVGLVVIALSAMSRVSRLWSFARLFSVALLAAVLMSALFPAVGPYAFYQPRIYPDGHWETVGALWHLDALNALRGGRLQALALSEIRGLVTFPSFHACLAVLTAWALAPVPVIGPLAILLNAVIIVATLGAGGHYLPDVLAGTAMGLALVACHAVQRGRSAGAARAPLTLSPDGAVGAVADSRAAG
ncbi:MAG TPA: phosphatase PAP2 family protein [Methylorubrum populi]|uniref:Phosphatase PAP2 family protein n=1 Tax=Methylorubrum populi TaxID=223967 RepID=A0A921JGM0_9HYPH|nr:phosphatase PAP2 family protein [Methylorubrum populi]